MPAERPGTHDALTLLRRASVATSHRYAPCALTQEGKLPKHWETELSKTTGETFYVNMISGESQYELPDASQL